MTAQEYWDGDPHLVKGYREAYEYRTEIKNQDFWLQGLYIYNAFSSVIAQFSHSLAGGKGKKPKGYLEYPIAITEREKEAEKQRKIKHTLDFIEKGQKKK